MIRFLKKSPSSTPQKPRIVFVLDALLPGGMENVASQQIQNLPQEKYDKILLLTRKADHGDLSGLERSGVRVVKLGRTRRYDLMAYLRMVRLFRSADLVLGYGISSGANAALFGRMAFRPKVAVASQGALRRLSFGDKSKRGLTLSTRMVLTAIGLLSHRLVVSSRRDLEEYQTVWPKKQAIEVIYNGVEKGPDITPESRKEARQALGMDPEAFCVGILARLDPPKGYEYFLEMAAIVKKEFLGSRALCFLSAGRGGTPYSEEIKAMVRQKGLDTDVRFLGHRTDVNRVLAAMDVMVLSSISECLPMALLEAMAVGLPCVATDVGGVSELIADGETGFVTPVADPRALASRIIQLAEDPGLTRSMGQASRKRVSEHFSGRSMLQDLEKLIQGLL